MSLQDDIELGNEHFFSLDFYNAKLDSIKYRISQAKTNKDFEVLKGEKRRLYQDLAISIEKMESMKRFAEQSIFELGDFLESKSPELESTFSDAFNQLNDEETISKVENSLEVYNEVVSKVFEFRNKTNDFIESVSSMIDSFNALKDSDVSVEKESQDSKEKDHVVFKEDLVDSGVSEANLDSNEIERFVQSFDDKVINGLNVINKFNGKTSYRVIQDIGVDDICDFDAVLLEKNNQNFMILNVKDNVKSEKAKAHNEDSFEMDILDFQDYINDKTFNLCEIVELTGKEIDNQDKNVIDDLKLNFNNKIRPPMNVMVNRNSLLVVTGGKIRNTVTGEEKDLLEDLINFFM